MLPEPFFAAVRDDTAQALATPITPSFVVWESVAAFHAFDLTALAARMRVSPIISRIPTRVATADERHRLQVVWHQSVLKATHYPGFTRDDQLHAVTASLYEFLLVEERWALLASVRQGPGLRVQAQESGRITHLDAPMQPEMAVQLARTVGTEAILILHPSLAEWLTAHDALPDDLFCFTHDQWPGDTLLAVDLAACTRLTGESSCVAWRAPDNDTLMLPLVIAGERALLCPPEALAGVSGITRKVV